MSRLKVIVPAVLMALVASLAPVGAGANGPTWSIDPSSGPSPNTIDVEGNQCEFNDVAAGVTLGGFQIASGAVTVVLRNKADTATLEEEEYTAFSGDWDSDPAGFPIPPGLSPGVYPMKAHCGPILIREAGGVVLGQNGIGFDYPDLSYRVVAAAEPPEAVEADVSLTG